MRGYTVTEQTIYMIELYVEYFDWWNEELREPEFYNYVIDWHLYDWQAQYTREPITQHITGT
jgi:hypothetical protein